ncbi:O-antigen ligase family protein [Marinobacter sp. F4216]|uniref:O-antigen ligase family protein n=1 Tax=Marinobacter sp. F4216 TaxID=2874281 RepID=UPI001CBAF136|nr:O-antigen ligase family protein [Marinobacter sp. F4216]MBZ2167684.1 O-antigen ligase family protein [Marinobacter sp. F4216]
MGKLIVFVLICACAYGLIFAPWIASLAYVATSLLQPQYLWPWVFQGVPIFNITAGLAIIGLILTVTSYDYRFDVFKRLQNIMLIFMLFLMHLSHHFSPFKGSPASTPPELILDTINVIVLMYFVVLGLCQQEKTLKYLCYIFILIGVYYTYYANVAYLNGSWFMFEFGRLKGPAGSPYKDSNVLAALIVMCMPFLIFMIFRIDRFWKKMIITSIVLLAWHAMVLFGSRGALLASSVSLLLVASIIRSAKLNVIMGVGFVLFLIYQGAVLMDRTNNTVDRAQESAEEPLDPRLVSWRVGLLIIEEYPFLGAGVQMFQAASQSLAPGETSNVAHNAFLNFSANTGLPTGFLFLGFIWMAWTRLRYAKRIGGDFSDSDYYALVCSSISILGYFVCSLFLDLIIYEPFYIALAINLIAYVRVSDRYKT